MSETKEIEQGPNDQDSKPGFGNDMKKKVKLKMDSHLGITDRIDEEGRTVILVDLFDKDKYDAKYNGKYVIDRIEVRHQDLWAELANQSKNAVDTGKVEDIAQEIVSQRKGEDIQVKHIMEMLKNDGVDPKGVHRKLTDDEMRKVNQDVAKGMDIAKVYSNMPTLLSRMIIEYPEGLTLDSEDDWGHFHPGLGKELFDRCMSLLMGSFSISKSFQKKSSRQ